MTLVDSLYCTKRLLRNQGYELESEVRSNVKPIPIIRAAHLLPYIRFLYIRFLRAAGAPVESHLRQARLPVLLADEPEAKTPAVDAAQAIRYKSGKSTQQSCLLAAGLYKTQNRAVRVPQLFL